MAKYTSIIQPSGTISGATFVNAPNGPYIRRPTSNRDDKWWRNKKLLRAQQRAIEFGGASQAASAILGQLTPQMRQCGDRYTHNHLLNAIRRGCTLHRKYDQNYPGIKSFALTTLSTQGIAAALHRRQFGKSTETRPTITYQITPSPTGQGPGQGSITISGLHAVPEQSAAAPKHALSDQRESSVDLPAQHNAPASSTTQNAPNRHSVKANSRLYLRIHIARVRIDQMHRPQHASRRRAEFQFQDGSSNQPLAPNHSTGWFPLAALECHPDEGRNAGTIQLPAPPPPDDAPGAHTAIFVAIEWRQYTGLRYKNLHERSTLTAIYVRPEHTQHVPDTKAGRTQASPFHFLREHYRQRIQARAKAHLEARYRTRTDPKAQLSKAIAHLTPPTP